MPIINIKYGKLISPFLLPYMKEKYPNFNYPTEEEVLEKIDVFKKYYEERGVSLLESLLKETGLNFTNKRIDVFVVDAIQKSMSAPLILSAHHGKEFFLQELLHELVHVLMGDNHSIVPKLHDNKTVNSHIYVFYFLRKIGIDEKPKTKDYIEAWELSKNCEDLRLLFKKQKEELGL